MKWWGLSDTVSGHSILFPHKKKIGSTGRWYSQKYYDELHKLPFSQHDYRCKMFTPGFSINTSLLCQPGLAVKRGGCRKEDGSGMWFLGLKSSCLKTIKASMM